MKDLLSKYENLKFKKEELKKEVDKLIDEMNTIKKEIQKKVLEDELYLPEKELENYKGKEIEEISLIVEQDGNRKVETFRDWYDFLEIDKNGKFYLSDYTSGIIEWNAKKNRYEMAYHYNNSDFNILGFFELKLKGNEWDEVIKCEETMLENIVQK